MQCTIFENVPFMLHALHFTPYMEVIVEKVIEMDYGPLTSREAWINCQVSLKTILIQDVLREAEADEGFQTYSNPRVGL